MKKTILILFILSLVFNTNTEAQIQIGSATPNGIYKPKKERNVKFYGNDFSITGNKTKTFTLVSKTSKFKDYVYTIRKNKGKAKATFTIFINGIADEKWTFESKIPNGEKTIKLSNVKGKEVVLMVKNHSATNKIAGDFEGIVVTNSMLINPSSVKPEVSNSTITKKITRPVSYTLNTPKNGKGTINVVRLNGNSSAEIVIKKGNTVIKTETINANQTSRRINLTNLNNNSGWLKLEIRDIETNEFIRAKIGAWFN